MNTEHLRLFTSLVNNLNFSVTAKEHHLSQSAVSQAINSLENELDFKLFKRTNRTVTVTKAGHSFYHKVQTILTALDTAVEEGRTNYQTEISNLNLAATGTSFEQSLLPQIFNAYHQDFPHIKIHLNYQDHNLLKQDLVKGKCDAIFTTQDDVDYDERLAFWPLIAGNFQVILTPEHPLAKKGQLDYQDLTGQTLLLFSPNWCPPLQARLQKQLKEKCPQAELIYVDNVAVAKTMLESNFGLAVMPSFIHCPKDSHLTTVPFNDTTPVTYGLATLKHPQISLQDFTSWLNHHQKQFFHN